VDSGGGDGLRARMARRSGRLRRNWNNVGPRLGFAYRIPGKHETVDSRRAGVFFGPTVSNTIAMWRRSVLDVGDLFGAQAERGVRYSYERFSGGDAAGADARVRSGGGGRRPNTSWRFSTEAGGADFLPVQFRVQREVAPIVVEVGTSDMSAIT